VDRTACNTLGWDPTVDAVPGSVGEPMPNCEIMLVDDEDNEVKQGEAGEILARGPNKMTAYLNNPKATNETLLPNGWLRTGDVARVSDQGWYYIVDRKKVRDAQETLVDTTD
jgi:4-coumarate--CoA ligase